VRPGAVGKRLPIAPGLFASGYLIFYPANVALSFGLVKVVGNLGTVAPPVRLRRPIIGSTGKIVSWVIENGETTVVKKILSEEERTLPLAEIWNHEFLQERIFDCWLPWMLEDEESEGAVSTALSTSVVATTQDNGEALTLLSEIARPAKQERISHYLYFDKAKVAKKVASDLRVQGFSTECDRSADGIHWLVLASHKTKPSGTDLSDARAFLERLAERSGGEYDGWEIKLAAGGRI
jgi:hypothetical protein